MHRISSFFYVVYSLPLSLNIPENPLQIPSGIIICFPFPCENPPTLTTICKNDFICLHCLFCLEELKSFSFFYLPCSFGRSLSSFNWLQFVTFTRNRPTWSVLSYGQNLHSTTWKGGKSQECLEKFINCEIFSSIWWELRHIRRCDFKRVARNF